MAAIQLRNLCCGAQFRVGYHGSAFSLIEFLVGIKIVAVLAVIPLPVYGRIQKNACSVDCTSNLRQTGAALFS